MKPLKNNIFCGKHALKDHQYNVEFYIMKASVQCSLPMWTILVTYKINPVLKPGTCWQSLALLISIFRCVPDYVS